jgi:nucleoid-associated protein YgaU
LRSLLLVLAGLALALPPRPGGAELADMYAEVRRALTELVRAAAPASEPTRLAATTLQAPGIGTEARRTRQPARSLGAPTFSRVVITPKGTSTFEGDGAPGSRVTISIGGRVIGTQAVGPLGRWRISLERPLPAGDHHIESSARFETGTQVLVGDEVRVAIPPSFTGSAIVAYDAARDGPAQRATDREGAATSSPAPARSAEQAAVRRRAEELADRASRGFDEIQRKAMQSDGVSEGREVAARLPSGTESDAVHGSWTDAVLDWLHRANRDYQREIAGKLARAPHGSKPATPGDARPAGVPTVAAEHGSDAAEQARTAARERLFAEEEARRKAERDALLARGGSRQMPPVPGATVRHDRVSPPPPDATRPSEPRTGGEESVVSEAELAAERAASEELAQRIERRRQAAEAARLRAEARARESATTDEAERRRLELEAQRRLAEERKAVEAKRLADEAERRRQELEAQRRLAEERKAAEAKRLADEAERRRQEEEAQRKLAEERKTIEARGLMAEEARRREAALRKQAEERMAANGEKQPRVPARVEPVDAPRSAVAERRAAGERTSPAGGAAGNVEVLREPAPGRAGGKDGVRRPDSRIAEGSAEKGPVDGAVPSGRRTTARVDSRRRQGPEPTTCRGRKAGRRVDLPGVYIVRRGDTLWAIARRHYGSGARYPLIYRANRRTIADPDLIYPCQRIHLPRRGRRG